eukprot:766914-Hanusia_phi.AAC.6
MARGRNAMEAIRQAEIFTNFSWTMNGKSAREPHCHSFQAPAGFFPRTSEIPQHTFRLLDFSKRQHQLTKKTNQSQKFMPQFDAKARVCVFGPGFEKQSCPVLVDFAWQRKFYRRQGIYPFSDKHQAANDILLKNFAREQEIVPMEIHMTPGEI